MERRVGSGVAVCVTVCAFVLAGCGRGRAGAAGAAPGPAYAGGEAKAAAGRAAAPQAPANLPTVGDEIAVPAVRLGRDALVIAYKHGHPGYQETYGFDTELFRFRANGNGTLREVAVNERLMDGEVTVDGLDFSHVDSTVTVKSAFEGKGGSDCVLRPEGGALVARGKGFVLSYSAPEPGSLRIERDFGGRKYVEEWSKADGGTCVVSDSRGEGASGGFEGGWPKPGRYVERPDADASGGNETVFEFFDLERGLKFRAESAEPLGEGLFLNLSAAFPAGPDLEAVALLDITLGEGRRITPVLARLFLSSK